MFHLRLAGGALALIVATGSSVLAHDFRVGDLTIDHPWSRATAPSSQTGAVYFTITNAGEADDRLVGGTTDIADFVEIHLTRFDENGVMQMTPVGGVQVPAGGTAELSPGAYHIMLIGLAAPLVEGESFPLTLVFEASGETVVEVTVEAPGGHGGHGGHGDHTGH